MISDEKDRIARFIRTQEPDHAVTIDVGTGTVALILGAAEGDDAALFRLHGDIDLVATTDYVRGTKFALYELGHLTLYDLGYYLVVANLSDIAAMGATPIGVLAVIRYPPEMSDDEFAVIVRGITDAARDHGARNVGGDIGEAERLILSGTALGAVAQGSALTRSGAAAGNDLWLTGPIGVAGAAVIYFSSLRPAGVLLPPKTEDLLLEAWRRPAARLPVGLALSRDHLATSCQDVSDGLRATLEELGRASGVGFQVRLDDIPIGQGVTSVASLLNVDPYALAMSASVDFELAFTAPASRRPDVLTAAVRAHVDCRLIGVATQETALVAVDGSGRRRPLPGVPWRQQPGAVADTIIQGISRGPVDEAGQ